MAENERKYKLELKTQNDRYLEIENKYSTQISFSQKQDTDQLNRLYSEISVLKQSNQ